MNAETPTPEAQARVSGRANVPKVTPPKPEAFTFDETKGFVVRGSRMRTLWEFLGSLRIAVLLLVVLAVVMTVGTLIESSSGVPAARRAVYGATWFHALLVFLAVNVLASALVRWPFKLHHTGFLITHGGIIVLLIGSLLNLIAGDEGMMILFEGRQASSYDSRERELHVQLKGSDQAVTIAATEFATPGPQSLERAIGGTGASVNIEGYLDNASIPTEMIPATEEGIGRPGAAVRLLWPGRGSVMDPERWTTFYLFDGDEDSPDSRHDFTWLESVRFHHVSDEAQGKQILDAAAGDHLLVIVLDDAGHVHWVAANGDERASGGLDLSRGSSAVPQALPWEGVHFALPIVGVDMELSRRMGPAPAEDRQNYPSGVACRLVKGGERSKRIILLPEEIREVLFGGQMYTLAFRPKPVDVPFTVLLRRASVEYYPGTGRPKEYKSLVTLIDEEQGTRRDVQISMNQPLIHRGYKMFQSSMAQNMRSGPAMSGLQVADYPGTSTIYVGSLLLVLGTVLVFWGGPFSRNTESRA